MNLKLTMPGHTLLVLWLNTCHASTFLLKYFALEFENFGLCNANLSAPATSTPSTGRTLDTQIMGTLTFRAWSPETSPRRR